MAANKSLLERKSFFMRASLSLRETTIALAYCNCCCLRSAQAVHFVLKLTDLGPFPSVAEGEETFSDVPVSKRKNEARAGRVHGAAHPARAGVHSFIGFTTRDRLLNEAGISSCPEAGQI
jgi:hypothetical protein